MSENPLDRIPSFDRVSIRAVIVPDGEDPTHALSEAGILDPVALPVVFGEDQPGIGFGDGITPNLSGVLEPDLVDDEFDSCAEPPTANQPGAVQRDSGQQNQSATTLLPAAYGTQPLAPVRPRVR
jgi:hypothetical protein